MIARTQAGRLKLLASIRHGIVVMSAVLLLSAGGLGAEIVLRNRQGSDLEHQDQLIAQQIRQTQGEVNRANRLVNTSVASDLSSVAKVQSAIEESAAKNNCSVTEFHASSEISPFLTRFAKTTGVSGWGQVEVQVSLSGKAKDVLATLNSMVDTGVPYEFDSLEMTRDKVDEIGDATIIGHATFRVLIRTAKVTS